MSHEIRKLITKLVEIESTDTSEYDEIITNRFAHKAPRFHQETQSSLEAIKNLYPDLVDQAMKTESGNFIVRYLENDNYVFIIGITSSRGKLSIKDHKEIYVFIEMFLDALREGKQIVTSPNEKSLKLINRVIRMGENQGMTINMNKDLLGNVIGGDPTDPELNFYQVTLSAL